MHRDDNNHVGWLLFYAMKAKSRDTDAWRRENYHNAALREIRVRELDNMRVSMTEVALTRMRRVMGG
ncbi:MAG: hypothetical protein AUF65_01210 [Chloroflexi bacterium 13_1_20CM_50_12]|nr:MAG: hypothetical protein AUF65_01210 [Chloroflexi bacterium 13_1_20CM_50_12]